MQKYPLIHYVLGSFFLPVCVCLIVFPCPVNAENPYGTDVSITSLDIYLQTDFQNNAIEADVKSTMKNYSDHPVDNAEFWLCPGGYNDPDFGADIHRIYLLNDSRHEELPFSIRKIDETWETCKVEFKDSIQPGQTVLLRFVYTMTGESAFKSSPILISDIGIKEIYLRGSDYLWCPVPYHDIRSTKKNCPPDWTLRIKYPSSYTTVTSGELLLRSEKNGWIEDEWKSLKPGIPCLYASQYNVVKKISDGVTFEMVVPDRNVPEKIVEILGKYAQMYGLYSELFGDPELSVYRIVGSGTSGVGAAFTTGFMTHTNRLAEIHHVAHEMAHLWWGGLVSMYGPGWKFLSEAMAEFSARWILQVMGEEQEEHQSLSDGNILGWKQRQFCTYVAADEPPARLRVPLIFQEGFKPMQVQARNYHWGPLAVNQIRLILGDETFFKALKTFIAQYRDQQAGIEEFMQVINDVSGMDMTPELKGLLWSTGFVSYRVKGFDSTRAGDGYRTKVTIQNEGEYGLTCPLLLKTVGGDVRTVFKVDGGKEKEFVFETAHRMVDVIVDPDSITLTQYHPDEKLKLWQAMLRTMQGYGNNEAYGESYIYYRQENIDKAARPISDYLSACMKNERAGSIEELLKKSGGSYAGYVFMRGIFHLVAGRLQETEEDVKNAFPYMLRALVHDGKAGAPGGYYQLGAIPKKDLNEYLWLLELIAGREFSFMPGSNDKAKIQKIEEWEQWWETEGKQKKLDLTALRKKFELK